MDCHLFSRRQPSSMVTGTTQGGSNLLNLAFGYGTSNNNGNVLSQTITMPKQTSGTLTLQQTYGYDGVNRLQSVGETVTAGGSGGGAWSFTHGYDPFGNMWVSNASGLTAHSATPRASDQFGATTNRLTKAFDGSTLSSPYDAAGNLVSHPYVGTMQYDAENRQKQFTSGSTTATYHYDGDGRRVKRVLGGQTTVFVYDAFGMLAAEYSTATPTETGGRRYRTTDHLGSTRLVTDDSGAVKTRHDYVPFGEELPASSSAGNRNLVFGFGVSPSERHKFTGKERDAESGLDYFRARYHSSTMGRFSSPDPISYNLLRVVSPQRWNRYAYAVNNPLLFVDPDGRDAISVNFSQPAAGMGHQALIAVRLDGSATFGDFGPETPGRPVGRGQFLVRSLTTRIAFDSLGLPTEASMQKLLNEVSDLKEAEPATISFAYFKTAAGETQALSTYLETARSRLDAGDVPAYIVGFTDCAAFCSQGLRAAGIGDGARAATIPNIFQFFAVQGSDASFSGKTGKRQVNKKGSKEEVTSTFTPCPPGAAGSADCRGTAK